ncbi:hypothetical protein ABZ896_40625 [Streptomyces sp. NPDC047072]|uniref:hypothetical protein n=1 Tax=Streptomyces sp. NPDC047072 TaxID=3154809 RepID=UPI0033C779F3
MFDLDVFAGALRGDGASLETLRQGAHALCVAEELSSVFRVAAGPDGGQEAELAQIGSSGGGSVSLVSLPRSFRVEHIGHDARHFVVRATDGRTVRATPWQFSSHVKLLFAECNPLYEAQLDEAFTATPLLPDRNPEPERTPPVSDPVLGTIPFDESTSEYSATVTVGDLSLWLSFDGADVDRVTELLPRTRDLVTDFASIERAGREFLWKEGADGTESPELREHYLGSLEPNGLVMYRTGDFEIHFDDTSGDYYVEGYWPVACFRADRTPVSSFVEA